MEGSSRGKVATIQKHGTMGRLARNPRRKTEATRGNAGTGYGTQENDDGKARSREIG